MPRLTATDYLARHHFLRLLWREYPQTFAVLRPREQRQLHRYFQTQVTACDHDLLAERAQLTAAEPALPHVAGKAYWQLRAAFRFADNYAGEDDFAFNRAIGALARRRLGEGVFVTAVARPEPDLEALARALLWYEPRSDRPRSSSAA